VNYCKSFDSLDNDDHSLDNDHPTVFIENRNGISRFWFAQFLSIR
jgi:hypothetical protein